MGTEHHAQADHDGDGQGDGHVAACAGQARRHHQEDGHDVPGLGPEKAAGVDVALHLLHIRFGKALQGGEAGEEGGGDLVYPLVGALGGQAHGKEQLIILTVVQRAAGFRVFLQQQPDDLIYLFLGPHGHPSFCLGYKNGKLIVP